MQNFRTMGQTILTIVLSCLFCIVSSRSLLSDSFVQPVSTRFTFQGHATLANWTQLAFGSVIDVVQCGGACNMYLDSNGSVWFENGTSVARVSGAQRVVCEYVIAPTGVYLLFDSVLVAPANWTNVNDVAVTSDSLYVATNEGLFVMSFSSYSMLIVSLQSVGVDNTTQSVLGVDVTSNEIAVAMFWALWRFNTTLAPMQWVFFKAPGVVDYGVQVSV
jgi:hypothetical protein